VTTASFDNDLENNMSQVWSYDYAGSGGSRRQVEGNYTLAVSVDNPSASPGDTVNFTITTGRDIPPSSIGGIGPPPIDLKVDVELTSGLSVTGEPDYFGSSTNYTKPESVIYSEGVFTIGTVNRGEARTNSVTLPVTWAADAAGTQQCLTATLTGNPPPGVGPYDDDISDNVAKV